MLKKQTHALSHHENCNDLSIRNKYYEIIKGKGRNSSNKRQISFNDQLPLINNTKLLTQHLQKSVVNSSLHMQNVTKEELRNLLSLYKTRLNKSTNEINPIIKTAS